MNVGVYLVIRTLLLFFDILGIAMLGRMLVSLFTMGQPSKILNFLYIITEPIILPVRALCARFGWFQGTPIDMSFFITSVLLMVVSLLLQAGLPA